MNYKALAEFRHEIRRFLNFSEQAARAAPDTTILSKNVTLGSVRLPVTVTTALYEAEDNVAKLKLP